MLEQRGRLGLATVVTLTRANLPHLARGRWTPVLALASDLVDGRLARAGGTVTPFGGVADSLADAVFWTWFAFRNERDLRWRMASMLAWVVPAAAVTVLGFTRGRMVDAPRPTVLRPAAAMQALLTVRAVLRDPREYRH